MSVCLDIEYLLHFIENKTRGLHCHCALLNRAICFTVLVLHVVLTYSSNLSIQIQISPKSEVEHFFTFSLWRIQQSSIFLCDYSTSQPVWSSVQLILSSPQFQIKSKYDCNISIVAGFGKVYSSLFNLSLSIFKFFWSLVFQSAYGYEPPPPPYRAHSGLIAIHLLKASFSPTQNVQSNNRYCVNVVHL